MRVAAIEEAMTAGVDRQSGRRASSATRSSPLRAARLTATPSRRAAGRLARRRSSRSLPRPRGRSRARADRAAARPAAASRSRRMGGGRTSETDCRHRRRRCPAGARCRRSSCAHIAPGVRLPPRRRAPAGRRSVGRRRARAGRSRACSDGSESRAPHGRRRHSICLPICSMSTERPSCSQPAARRSSGSARPTT